MMLGMEKSNALVVVAADWAPNALHAAIATRHSEREPIEHQSHEYC